MIEFITQNPLVVIGASVLIILIAGMVLTAVKRHNDYVFLKGCAEREQARMAEQAEQTGVEPECPCSGWEACEGCEKLGKRR